MKIIATAFWSFKFNKYPIIGCNLHLYVFLCHKTSSSFILNDVFQSEYTILDSTLRFPCILTLYNSASGSHLDYIDQLHPPPMSGSQAVPILENEMKCILYQLAYIKNETAIHYVCECPAYQTHRHKLYENINKLINPGGDLITITHTDKSYLLNTVLCGCPNLTLKINTRLIHAVQTFITESGRFHNK